MTTLALEAIGIHKHFGGVRALAGADIAVRSGEVVALVGDNGAGKSTLVKTLCGAETPDEGAIKVFGEDVVLSDPRFASDKGIQIVHQDLAICPNLDAVENLFLGRELRYPWWLGRCVNRPEMEERTRALLDSMGVVLPSLRTPIGALSGGQRQALAICRAILFDAPIVVLDEPTAALGVRQRQRVLDLVTRLRDAGKAVLVISHDLADVQEIADRIYVLRLGKTIAAFDRGAVESDTLVGLLTGTIDSIEHQSGFGQLKEVEA